MTGGRGSGYYNSNAGTPDGGGGKPDTGSVDPTRKFL